MSNQRHTHASLIPYARYDDGEFLPSACHSNVPIQIPWWIIRVIGSSKSVRNRLSDVGRTFHPKRDNMIVSVDGLEPVKITASLTRTYILKKH